MSEIQHNFSHRKVLVTGGTGFVGGHLVESLVALGNRVVVIERSIDPGSYFFSKRLNEKVTLVHGDIKDERQVLDIVSKYDIDFIFHLAAQPIVETAFNNPVETIETNVMGTTYVLEAARRIPTVKGVVVASSDKAYGKLDRPYIEEDALRGDHPYEVSKSSADLIAQMYIKTYGLPIVITRFGNIYGEGDLNFSRVLPGLILAALREESFKIRSNGLYKRSYLYVKDVVEGYVRVAEQMNVLQGQSFNFGSNEVYSVLDLVTMFENIFKTRLPYSIENTAKNEIINQELDFSKAQQLINWQPKFSVEMVLSSMVTWYHQYEMKQKVVRSAPKNSPLPQKPHVATNVIFST